MRKLLLLILFVACIAPHTMAQEDSPMAVTEAFVTLRVKNLDDAALARLSSAIGKEANTVLEYSCVRSGVLILHFRALKASEKADVITVVERLLLQARMAGPFDFLDVHVEKTGGNKC